MDTTRASWPGSCSSGTGERLERAFRRRAGRRRDLNREDRGRRLYRIDGVPYPEGVDPDTAQHGPALARARDRAVSATCGHFAMA
jgi:hypothetical protein